MHIELYRNYFRNDYIIGKLFINDEYFCDTLEPIYKKEHGAIPVGTYKIALDIRSPRFHNRTPYRTLCNGCPPRLLQVPNRDGILIHIGNYPKDSQGCILLGQNIQVGAVLNSFPTFVKFYKKIKDSPLLSITINDVPLDSLSKDVLKRTLHKNEIEIPVFP